MENGKYTRGTTLGNFGPWNAAQEAHCLREVIRFPPLAEVRKTHHIQCRQRVEGQGLPDVRSPDHVFLKMLTRSSHWPRYCTAGLCLRTEGTRPHRLEQTLVAPSLMTPQTANTHGPASRRTTRTAARSAVRKPVCTPQSASVEGVCNERETPERKSTSCTVPSV